MSRDFLGELRVRPIINAAGSYTMMGGSLIRPEALEAMEALAKVFVRLDHLHDAVGEKIAALLGAPAALVSSGAAGALTCGMAGVLTGEDPERIRNIPCLEGMKSEVVVQKAHRFPYDHMIRNCGVKLVEVESLRELEAAIGPKTAMLLYLNKARRWGDISMEDFVRVGREAGVPTFNDAAADAPPVRNILDPIRIGFDLVAISGGKGIRGPQSTGILAGRKDLIAAARLNTAPHSDTIGRLAKVSKEEMVGLLVALELFLAEDHEKQQGEWWEAMERIRRELIAEPGVRATIFVPEIANEVPHLRVEWEEAERGLSYAELMERLRRGQPSIELMPDPREPGVVICSWTLQPGEELSVARRMKEVLSGKE